MMIGGLCASIQSELDALFARFKGSIGRMRCVSAQAFSKARQGFSATLFRNANDRLLEAAQDLFARHAWNGLRPIAADGSRLIVSTRAGRALKAEHFAFALYVPGAELTLHASLHPADGCERQMLFEALDLLQPGRDLLVLDRGYPAVWLAALLVQRGIDFCMRIDGTNWGVVKRFLRSGKNEAVVTLPQPPADKCRLYEVQRRPTQARLIRQTTPNGKVHVLLTSLLDTRRFPLRDFGDLYHRRWRIEEAFKRLKHRLNLEAVTGLNYLALQQDFHAKVLADNLCSLLATEHLADDGTDEPPRVHNRAYAIGALGAILAGCLLGNPHCRAALPEVLHAISRTRRRVTPGRSYPRTFRHKPHRHACYRPVRA